MYSHWNIKDKEEVRRMDLAISELGFEWGSPWTGGGWTKHWSQENGEQGEVYAFYDPESFCWTVEGLLPYKTIRFFGIDHLIQLFKEHIGMDITDCNKYVHVREISSDSKLPF